MSTAGSVMYTLNKDYAGLEKYGYAQEWAAEDEKYVASTRTYTATFKLRKGFVDEDGNIAFKLKLIFDAKFNKSVRGTTWLDIGKDGKVSKTYNEDAGYYTQVNSLAFPSPWGRAFIADEEELDEKHTMNLFQNGSY